MKLSKFIMTALLLSFSTNGLLACPNCFGAKGDPITESIGVAIMFLLVVIMGTVGGIIAFFVTIAKRSHKYEQQIRAGKVEWGENPELIEE